MSVKNQIWRPPPLPKRLQHLVRMKATELDITIELFLTKAIERALRSE